MAFCFAIAAATTQNALMVRQPGCLEGYSTESVETATVELSRVLLTDAFNHASERVGEPVTERALERGLTCAMAMEIVHLACDVRGSMNRYLQEAVSFAPRRSDDLSHDVFVASMICKPDNPFVESMEQIIALAALERG